MPADMMSKIDVFIVNESEAEQITGSKWEQADADQAASFLDREASLADNQRNAADHI